MPKEPFHSCATGLPPAVCGVPEQIRESMQRHQESHHQGIGGTLISPAVLVLSRSHKSVAWERTVDIFAVLIAAALPWSTSLVGIFVVGWLVVLAPTIDLRSFVLTLRRPFCALPIMLFAVAVVGTPWSEAAWSARLYAINPTAKLLVLPALIYHFQRSTRGAWVFVAFLVSC